MRLKTAKRFSYPFTDASYKSHQRIWLTFLCSFIFSFIFPSSIKTKFERRVWIRGKISSDWLLIIVCLDLQNSETRPCKLRVIYEFNLKHIFINSGLLSELIWQLSLRNELKAFWLRQYLWWWWWLFY